MLSAPICGVAGVWNEEATGFFKRTGTVKVLTEREAFTLYSFWNDLEARWTTEEELLD